MAENSKIEWCHHTFNPWRGCTKVSDGCKHCYAETLSGRNPGTLGVWGPSGTRVVASEAMWREPLKWNRAAQEAGERHRVFCASLADVFEGRDTMPETSWNAVEEARLRLFDLIRLTPHLDWLLLTKRPENVLGQIEVTMMLAANRGNDALEEWLQKWLYDGQAPLNIWIGTSVEDQKTADKRIPQLMVIPAKVRFLSCEPLLSDVALPLWRCLNCRQAVAPVLVNNDKDFGCPHCRAIVNRMSPFNRPGSPLQKAGIDWVICGGESGPNARPMHPDWARSLRDQCVAADVAFHFKQWGEWIPSEDLPDDSGGRGLRFVGEDCQPMTLVGKKKAGRLLDGRTWDEFPEPNA